MLSSIKGVILGLRILEVNWLMIVKIFFTDAFSKLVKVMSKYKRRDFDRSVM